MQECAKKSIVGATGAYTIAEREAYVSRSLLSARAFRTCRMAITLFQLDVLDRMARCTPSCESGQEEKTGTAR